MPLQTLLIHGTRRTRASVKKGDDLVSARGLKGLFIGPVQRNAAGRRVFSEQEIGWLHVCSKLRSTGMPLPDIRRYAELVRDGSGTVEERFRILREHEARVRIQLADLQDVLSTIEAKVAYYAGRLAEGTADQLWVNGPECTAISATD
jgi:DNA-binding transcriptional MerR regulator